MAAVRKFEPATLGSKKISYFCPDREWKNKLKKSLIFLVSIAVIFSVLLGACAPETKPPVVAQKLVGISMPTKTLTRWIADGDNMVKVFTDMGYQTDLQYADNDISYQHTQIEDMITKGVNVLIIAAADGSTLSDLLQKAHDKGILVIAYDRLISNTPNVDYYVTFDNFQVGVLQASQIEKALGLKDGKGPFNIELFGGSSDDSNAFYFYDGAMTILKPYIDNKKLIVQSGEMGMDKVSTLHWDDTTARARMDQLLSTYYTEKRVDAVLAPNDVIGRGILLSLKNAGYGTSGHPWPVVTGQDAEIASVKSIIAGEQSFTVFKDTRELARQTAKIVDAALQGKDVPINDTKTYNNGAKIVSSFLLTPVSVDISNYVKLLVDSGYYTAEQLK